MNHESGIAYVPAGHVPRIVAFDPGEVHVGCADFRWNPFSKWQCVEAVERTPFDALRWLEGGMVSIDVVVYETFQIYPDKAALLIGSKCETAQNIGAIRWLVESYNGKDQLVDLVEQPAAVKAPTLAMLRRREVKSVAKRHGAGGHALDAELHGWCFILRRITGEMPDAI